MHYVIDGGELRLERDGKTVFTIPADGTFAVLMDNDARHERRMAGIITHGPHENVLATYRDHWARLQRGESNGPEGADILRLLGPVLGAQGDARSNTQVFRDMAADMEMVSIPVAEMTDEMVEEFNACLSTTGRIGRFHERVDAMRAAAPGPRR